jgi:glycosyltransferase involved in cell wall biosynthesis
MGLSVLIPVYNTLVGDLVNELHTQASKLTIPFEIIIADDCSELSTSYLNMKLRSLPHLTYNILSENIGRSKIRNLLFKEAKYENCIIMDGDVAIRNPDFLINYLKELKPGVVVCGGHTYSASPPENSEHLLHWKYGTNVEVKSAAERNKNPYSGFKTVCFAIQKTLFEKIKFEESVSGYGHEDTLFGIALQKAEIKVIHTDNPVIHLGLDETYTFLEKQKQAIANLKKIYANSSDKLLLESNIRLLKWVKVPFLVEISALLEPVWMFGLEKKNPSVLALQLLKLSWWEKH